MKPAVIREVQTRDDAYELFKEWNANEVFLQWKNTDACIDFHCPCGEHNHYDGYFASPIQCGKCKAVYAVRAHMEVARILHPEGYAKQPEIDWENQTEEEIQKETSRQEFLRVVEVTLIEKEYAPGQKGEFCTRCDMVSTPLDVWCRQCAGKIKRA